MPLRGCGAFGMSWGNTYFCGGGLGMQKELIYKFRILLFSDNDKLIRTLECDHWEFPTDEEIIGAIEKYGADYAEVRRVYVVDTIPFTE